jgi:hypothetical protein
MRRSAHPYIRGVIEPGLGEADLAGCTDDPRVFALHGEMCRAIADGTWRPGPRSLSAPSPETPPRGGAAPGTPAREEIDRGG